MGKTRLSGLEQEVVGGTEGGRSPTGVPPTTLPRPARWPTGKSRFPAMSDEEILAGLLALNLERAAGEQAGN